MSPVTPFKGSNLLSTRAFRRWKAAYWLFAAIWFGLVLAVALWLPIGGVWKGALLLVLAIFVPALSDLFESYEAYRADWLARNNGHDGKAP